MKLIASIFVFVWVSVSVFAGETVVANQPNNMQAKVEAQSVDNQLVISGSITDLNNDETLAGATIQVDGKKVYSDLDGHFVLPVENPGIYKLTVELISYETTELQVEVQQNSSLAIALAQK